MHPVQRVHALPPGYVEPTALEEVLGRLGDRSAATRVVAGGTDLLLEIQRGARTGIDTLVDITRIAGLDRIERRDGALHLGPLVTHTQVVNDPLVRAHAVPLAQACCEIGSPALRNRATVAGNVVTASPANDTISALLVLGASVTLRSARGERTLPIETFITGLRTTVLEPDEMVVDIAVPVANRTSRGVFVKLGNRRAQAISVVHVALVVELDRDQVVTGARIAIGSVAPTVLALERVASTLVGSPLTDQVVRDAAESAAGAAKPIDDVRATGAYRTHAVRVMVERALVAVREESVLPLPSPPRLARDGTRSTTNTKSRTATGSITAVLNGTPVTAPGAVGTTLLEWLREQARLRGTKEGCAEGECGACTVLLDGAAVLACLVPAGRADGAAVDTVEGLARDQGLHPVQRGFLAGGGVQCGFCTPGFLMTAAALLAERAEPDDDTVREAFAGNLCRCTGYHRIVASMAAAASP